MILKRLLTVTFLAFFGLTHSVVWAEDAKKEAPKEDKAAATKKAQMEDKTLFIAIKDMIVPIVQKRDIKGFLTVTYSYDCKSMEAKERLLKYLGTIQDRIFWDLYNTLGVVWAPDLYIKTGDLKEKMLKSLNATIDKPEINGLLIEDFRFYERDNS